MSNCPCTLARFDQLDHLEPPPLYLPWLSNTCSEHAAVVEEVLESGREWLVRYQASLWRACGEQADTQVATKDVVCVVGRHNLTLIIRAL